MRRLAHDDRGISMILVAASILVLFGMLALVLDVGVLFDERRQLQNGADAAALAIAGECVDGNLDFNSTGQGAAEALADQYADLNARDSESQLVSVTFSGDEEYVQVVLRTERDADGGPNTVLPLASGVLGNTGETVTATATAKCQPGGGVFPIVVSVCENDQLQADLANAPWPAPPDEARYMFHTPAQGGTDPAAGDPCHNKTGFDGSAAGFGWLPDEGDCSATLIPGQWFENKQGRAIPSDCNKSSNNPLDGEIALALFDIAAQEPNGPRNCTFYNSNPPAPGDLLDLSSGSPAQACFHITQIWLFEVTAYSFGGNGGLQSDPPPSDSVCNESATDCLFGRWVELIEDENGNGSHEYPRGTARLVPNSEFPNN